MNRERIEEVIREVLLTLNESRRPMNFFGLCNKIRYRTTRGLRDMEDVSEVLELLVKESILIEGNDVNGLTTYQVHPLHRLAEIQ